MDCYYIEGGAVLCVPASKSESSTGDGSGSELDFGGVCKGSDAQEIDTEVCRLGVSGMVAEVKSCDACIYLVGEESEVREGDAAAGLGY